MIEEYGRVIAVKHNDIWVETLRANACGACSAGVGCGQGILAKAASGKPNHICIHSKINVEVNDNVLIGLPEHVLVKSSLLAYGIPLFAFIIFVIIADTLFQLSEPFTILFGLSGLTTGFLLTRVFGWYAKEYADCLPVILKKLPKEGACLEQAPAT